MKIYVKNNIYWNLTILLLIIFITLFLFLHPIFAEQTAKKIITSNYEISYDNSNNLFIYPLEHGIDRTIKIKNIGNRNVSIEFHTKMIINGKDIEIETWPQWIPKYIKPNDEVDFIMKVEWTSNELFSLFKENIYFLNKL